MDKEIDALRLGGVIINHYMNDYGVPLCLIKDIHQYGQYYKQIFGESLYEDK
jgi:hypothetical protein